MITIAAFFLAAAEPDRIVYADQPRELAYHVFRPEGAQDPRPGVVFFHGGGWSSGSWQQFRPHAEHLAENGVVAVSVEYRLRKTDKSTASDSLIDCRAAYRHILDHAGDYGLDPARVAVGGGSAGGHLAACLGTGVIPAGDSKGIPRPFAMVLFNPAVCLAPFGDYLPAGFEKGPKREANVARIGCDPVELSPLHHIDDQTPPTFIVHGDADKTVTVDSVRLFVAELRKRGIAERLVEYEGRPHGFFNQRRARSEQGSPRQDYEDTVRNMDAFLAERGFPLAPSTE